MKIAIHHTRYSRVGGSEGYIHCLLEWLLERGHEVHYFASKWEPYDHPRLEFHRIPYIRGWPVFKVMSFAYNSRRALAREEFDLIHGFTKGFYQDVYTDGSGCFQDYHRFARSARPLLAWGWRHLGLYAAAVKHVERKRFRRGNFVKILTMSRFVKDQIQRRYGLDDNEVEVLYNGVDIERFHPEKVERHRGEVRQSLGTPPDARVAVFVGNDYLRKGLPALLRGLAQATAPWHLWVLGQDRDEAPYRNLASELGCAERVLFVGPQRDPERYFAAADTFVFPSLYDVFGNVGLEAMAAGLPTVLSGRAGVSELIDDGRDGLLLPDPEDAEEISRALDRLASEESRRRIGAAARQTAAGYSWELHFERLAAVYEEVIEIKAARRAGASNPRGAVGVAYEKKV